MNKNFFAGLFVGLGLLAIFAFKPSESKPNSEAAVLQKWDYYRVPAAKVLESQIKVAGFQGWEMVAIEGDGDIWFKRPI